MDRKSHRMSCKYLDFISLINQVKLSQCGPDQFYYFIRKGNSRAYRQFCGLTTISFYEREKVNSKAAKVLEYC